MFARFLMIVCAAASFAVLAVGPAGADDLPLGFSVRLILDGEGSGSVHATSTGFSHTYSTPHCSPTAVPGSACIVAQYNGLPILFQATAAPGSVFSGWLGSDCTGKAAACTAYGNGQLQPLAVDLGGTGSGTVVGSAVPSGATLSCPGACDRVYSPGALVSLVATPAAQSVFTGWGGACAGTSTTCMVSMTEARNVTATFNASLTSLLETLSVTVAGQGTVTGPGIACAPDCGQSYAKGTSVTLTPHAAAGATFTGWSGACTGSATCVLSLTTDRAATATFAPVPAPGSGGNGGGAGNSGGAPAGQPSGPGSGSGAGAGSGSTPAGSTPASPGGAKPPAATACTIVGTPGKDVLVGTSHRDVICGRGGDDRILGKGGADLLRGGLGRDVLLGGLGADRLEGGAGIDVFYAHDGLKDSLAGGAGRDSARVDRGKDVVGGIETVS